MPFLPFVLLLAWQALSKSASFALGWATALYFGQVPGSKGRLLAVIGLVSAGWVIVVVGFAIPLAVGAAFDTLALIARNFEIETIHVVSLVSAIVLVPPALAAAVVIAEFLEDRSLGRWLRTIPDSYPATLSLGIGVLMMVAITPFLLIQRLRHKKVLVQVPLVMRAGADDDHLTDAIRGALRSIDVHQVKVDEIHGPRAWPLRAVGFAARHLLGATVRADPIRMRADGLEVYAYATNVAVLGPKEDAHRARASLERELVFSDARVTWSEDSQELEGQLKRIHAESEADPEAALRALDRVQEKIDRESLNAEEWNVLFRIRLQIERAIRAAAQAENSGSASSDGNGHRRRGRTEDEVSRAPIGH